MELNKKQIFLIILFIMLVFPPVYSVEPLFASVYTGCWEVANYTFVKFVVGAEYDCFSFKNINYPLLILQILIMCGVFLFILFKKKK
jgi:hypothetical protein